MSLNLYHYLRIPALALYICCMALVSCQNTPSEKREYDGKKSEFFKREALRKLDDFYKLIIDASAETEMTETYLKSLSTMWVDPNAVFQTDFTDQAYNANESSLEAYTLHFQQSYRTYLESYNIDPTALQIVLKNPEYDPLYFTDDYHGVVIGLRYDLTVLSGNSPLYTGESYSVIAFPDITEPASYQVRQVAPSQRKVTLMQTDKTAQASAAEQPASSVSEVTITYTSPSNTPAHYHVLLNQNDLNAKKAEVFMYGNGKDVKQNIDSAYYYFRKSHTPEGMTGLGRCLHFGIGTQKDIRAAIGMYEQALERGYKPAAYWLAECYAESYADMNNPEEALRYYQMAARDSVVDAWFKLGMLYHEGRVIKKDHKQAYGHFKVAAEKGSFNALYMLGEYYKEGICVNQDTLYANKLFEQYITNRNNDFYKKYGSAVNQDTPYINDHDLLTYALFMDYKNLQRLEKHWVRPQNPSGADMLKKLAYEKANFIEFLFSLQASYPLISFIVVLLMSCHVGWCVNKDFEIFSDDSIGSIADCLWFFFELIILMPMLLFYFILLIEYIFS